MDFGKVIQPMQEIGKDLLEKYFTGQCSPDEERRVESWLNSGKTDVPPPEEFIQNIDNASLKEEIWREVMRVSPKRRLRRSSTFDLLKISACFVFFVAASFFLYQNRETLFYPEQEPDYQTIYTGMAQKMNIDLLDGSHIVLNSGSQLRFPKKFKEGERIVELQGEAFLEVAEDASRPFTVITQGARIRVLGTKFDVKAYSDDVTSSIVVEEGKVRVTHNNGEHVILAKGQMCFWNRKDQTLIKQQTNAEQHTAWTRGDLVFKDKSLAEITPVLERWYGVEISFENDLLKQHRFTGFFGEDPSFKDVIQSMSLTMQFNYRLEDNKLILK